MGFIVTDEIKKDAETIFKNRVEHQLKIQRKYWIDITTGFKTFEIRFNDRNFKVGDLIQFNVVNDSGEVVSQMLQKYIITYILDYPDALKEGYVVLAIKPHK